MIFHSDPGERGYKALRGLRNHCIRNQVTPVELAELAQQYFEDNGEQTQ